MAWFAQRDGGGSVLLGLSLHASPAWLFHGLIKQKRVEVAKGSRNALCFRGNVDKYFTQTILQSQQLVMIHWHHINYVVRVRWWTCIWVVTPWCPDEELQKKTIRHIEITFFARAMTKSSFYCTAANLPLITERSDHHSYMCKECKCRSISCA